MQSVANAHNLPIKVAAFSHNKLEEIIEKDTPDCIFTRSTSEIYV